MDFDRSSSSIVLDLAWGEVDRKNQDFIYAKDFPALIKSIETILNRGQQLPLALLSHTGKSVIDTFAKEKEFFKIYRDEFKEIFHGLVGKTFKDAIEGTNVSKSVLDERTGDESFIQDAVNTTPLKTQKSSPRKVNRLLKNLETRVSSMKEELRFKDDILVEKDRELIQLTRNLSDYKDKYEFVQRQFNFYKDHGESPRRNSTESDQKQFDVEHNMSTRHEFIISELKRKLQDQSLSISNLKEQLQCGEGAGVFYTNTSKKLKAFNIDSAILFAVAPLVSFAIILLISMIWLRGSGDDSNLISGLSWWENNSLLSRIGWFFRDWSDPGVNYVDFEPSTDAYDRIMGIRRL